MNLARYHLYANAKTKNVTVRLKPPPRAMRTGGWSGELNPAASRVSNRLMMRESLDGSFSLRLVMKGTVTGDATKKAVLCLLLKIDFVVVVVVVVEKAWLPLTINSKIDGKDRIVIEQNRIE